MKKALTKKQARVLEAIRSHLTARRQSPTLEELRAVLGCKSLRTVAQYLESLERKGYIVRRRGAKRNIELIGGDADGMPGDTISVPVVASVGCDNLSIYANELHDEFLEVDRGLAQGGGDIVAVRSIGDSMADAGIRSGDYILVQFTERFENGDRVAAVVNDMVVVKRLEKREGVMVLWPESKDPAYKPIILSGTFKLTGKVLCVIPNPAAEITEVVYE